MIRDFSGEFLRHPALLEVSGNVCSHKCVYCFAREKLQVADIKGFARQMANINKNGWVYRKMREGYPVCLSNNSDPFSTNNQAFTETILEYFNRYGIRVFFQTKGGERAAELIKAYGIRSVVYITITSDRDEVSKRIEPNAPATSERIELIKKLKAMGHIVMVGVNPMTYEWITDYVGFEKKLAEAGTDCLYFQPLLLKKKWLNRYQTRDFAGVDVFSKASNKGWDNNMRYFSHITDYQQNQGNIPFLGAVGSMYNYSYAKNISEVYNGKIMPTTTDFILSMIEKNGADKEWELRFEDFYKYFKVLGDILEEKTIQIVDRAVFITDVGSYKYFQKNKSLVGFLELAYETWAGSPLNNYKFYIKGKDDKNLPIFGYKGGMMMDLDGSEYIIDKQYKQ